MLLESLPDNSGPGWQLRIDLRGTTAAGFRPRRVNLSTLGGAWVRCTLSSHRFEGTASEVEEMIAVFRRWIDIDTETPDTQSTVFEAVSAG